MGEKLFKNKKSVLKIGLTGNIGSGKTTVGKIWKNLDNNFQYISMDEIGHKVVKKLQNKIIEKFGLEIVKNENIDNKKLSHLIFLNSNLYKSFMNLITPLMKKSIISEVKKITKGILIVDGALIFEYKLEKLFNYIVVVSSYKKTMIKRFCLKTNFSQNIVKNILNKQIDMKEKIKKADFVIYNNKSFEDLESNSKKVWEKIKTINFS
ncbi:MAG: dephospho-CoA kinase [bacterium]